MLTNLNRKALINALVAALLALALTFIGSRRLQNFDPALTGYLIGTIFAVFGVVYRYSIWLQRRLHVCTSAVPGSCCSGPGISWNILPVFAGKCL
ncbi:hypothetical protein [Chitinophaga agrisoli]|uniref:hypothetical protein n=1 Tax=Chitinophaga agrisoli TaxID=2607653 RepID=UPI001BC9065A|nr:hypothetical protein [Chitinophaga agrisoli]